MSKKDKIEQEEIINEQETVQVEENQEVEIEAVKEEPTPEELIQASNDKFLRLFAEFENYKKRTTKERIELFKTAGQEVMTSLLTVVDDFESVNVFPFTNFLAMAWANRHSVCCPPNCCNLINF